MKRIIGITGPIGSGKDTAAEYMAHKLGVSVWQISAPLKDKVREAGLVVSRENVMDMGYKIAAEHGEDYLAKLFLEQAGELGIVSGIRQLKQIEYLKTNSDFTMIAVTADGALRFARVQARGTVLELPTLVAFLAHEEHENTDPQSPMRLFECMKQADYTIKNDGDLESLYKKVDEVLEKLGF